VVVVLALASALAYGLSDFAGGLLARRAGAWSVAVVSQATSTALTAAFAFPLGGSPVRSDWLWAALAGIGSGVGSVFLYRGLASGRMSVVAPLSAVGAALVPVFVGVVTGERPDLVTWLGVVCAFPAIWLVSRAAGPRPGADLPVHSAVLDGLLAGVGFGGLFAALGQVHSRAGLAPLALTQGASVVAVVLLAGLLRQRWLPRNRQSAASAVVGVFGALATVLFLLATRSGLLSVAAVLSSLYPATTVLLAAVVLRERIERAQGVGLLLAALAVGLVAAG
jgi:drug/metabolite transporter (DMT)-like permease